MKRCPECRRDYYDDTLLYCLDDGNALLEGPATARSGDDEPATAILSEPGAIAIGFRGGEDKTRQQVNTTDQTAILHTGAEAEPPKSLGDAAEKQSFSANRAAKPRMAIGLAVILLIGGFFGYRYFASSSKQIESIAVMPFVNATNDQNIDYLTEGISDNIINGLSGLPNLKVMSRNAVFHYKGADVDAQFVAKELKVQAVLTGRVTQRADKIQVSVELISGQDNSHIWGQQYSRTVAEAFAVQEEIAKDISEKLGIKLTGAESQQLVKLPTENIKAFQFYTQGRSYAQHRIRGDLLRAIDYYEGAIREDNNYALAYAGLAEAYSALGVRGYIDPVEGRNKAVDAARRAMVLDKNLAEAHVSIAQIAILFAPYDLSLAERELARAIELNPSFALAHLYVGLLRERQGRFDDALTALLKACELDPFSPIFARAVSVPYLFKRDYARALDILKHADELGPAFIVPNEIGVYIQSGLLDETLSRLEKAKQERANDPILVSNTGMVYAAQKNRNEALRIIKQLDEMSGPGLYQAHWIAKIYATMNDKEAALSWLERGLTAGTIGDFYKDEPVWDPLRNDPRFKDLLKRIGLPE